MTTEKNLVLETLSLNPTPRRPVWVMRQAGRYQASFRKLREKYSFEQLCHEVDLATQVSLKPIEQYNFDAAIVFSDILFPLRALGAKLAFTEKGPKIEPPRSVDQLEALNKTFNPHESTPAILKTIENLRAALPKQKAVLGFAGAPFTMLTYLLEGELTKDLSVMKRWMAEQPQIVHRWLGVMAECTGSYLDAQAEAGADAVQLFETCASALCLRDYEEFALPYARQVFSEVTVPGIYYVNGIAGILDQAASVGAQALSVDWRVDLSEVRRRVPQVTALQGNLDPYHLHLSPGQLRQSVLKMLSSYGTGPGHIVNLVHGIMPSAPEDAVKVFVDTVAEFQLKA
jgi:uroporphyrinogen decarboxylase